MRMTFFKHVTLYGPRIIFQYNDLMFSHIFCQEFSHLIQYSEISAISKKMEVDYSATVDEKIPKCEKLAKVSTFVI
jgi:hypothetical protein